MHRHVLVVEDDPDIRESLTDLLEEQGLTTLAAGDGAEALAKLTAATNLPCLILLDLMLPVMDGQSFREAQLLQPRLSEIPVVVLSAYRDAAARAKQMNAAGFLKKPFRMNDVRAYIDQFCGAAAG